jgi:LysR family glycine cleavage system transcriptional activator
VSHQVKALETELAIKLFNRERQRLVITEAGRDYLDYLDVVRDALDRIAVGTERLPQRQSAGVLTVSTSQDFARKVGTVIVASDGCAERGRAMETSGFGPFEDGL